MKLYHFIDYNIPFVRDSIGLAIQGLYKEFSVCSYSYDDLKTNNIIQDNSSVILFLEAGQTQPHHSGWNLPKFKKYFPNSKVILFCSDTEYYRINNLGLQFGNDHIDKVDFIFECTPQSADWLSSFGLNVKVIPWTISKKLYSQLRKLAGKNIDYSRKVNDFISVINIACPYRSGMVDYITANGYSFIQGGDNNCSANDLDKVYNNYLNSWITLGTTSHNNPQLNTLGTMKGWRDAVGIALNCLLVYDDHPNVEKVWDIENLPQYTFGEFTELNFWNKVYKEDKEFYKEDLLKQIKWLEEHLLDDLFYKELIKYA